MKTKRKSLKTKNTSIQFKLVYVKKIGGPGPLNKLMEYRHVKGVGAATLFALVSKNHPLSHSMVPINSLYNYYSHFSIQLSPIITQKTSPKNQTKVAAPQAGATPPCNQ